MFLLIDTNGVPKSTDLLSVPSSDVSLNIDFSLASLVGGWDLKTI